MPSFQVSGMTCNHCVRAVTQSIHEVDPAAVVRIDLPTGRVEVDTQAAPTTIATAITEAGYEATPATA